LATLFVKSFHAGRFIDID